MGIEQLILLNIEIEGSNDPDFTLRVFEYNYRIRDRYGLPVATIVVYTGDKNQKTPAEYHSSVLDTTISFQYRSYHILDHGEDELLEMDNIFALIVVPCQKALLEGKVPEDELGEGRSTIARALLAHGTYDNDRVIGFLVFLKNFIFIKNKGINRIFDHYISELSGGTIDMGVIETLKLQERREGEAKGEHNKAISIAREMKKDGLPIAQIAKFTKLSVKEIEKL